jgi:hypothetical protein
MVSYMRRVLHCQLCEIIEWPLLTNLYIKLVNYILQFPMWFRLPFFLFLLLPLFSFPNSPRPLSDKSNDTTCTMPLNYTCSSSEQYCINATVVIIEKQTIYPCKRPFNVTAQYIILNGGVFQASVNLVGHIVNIMNNNISISDTLNITCILWHT